MDSDLVVAIDVREMYHNSEADVDVICKFKISLLNTFHYDFMQFIFLFNALLKTSYVSWVCQLQGFQKERDFISLYRARPLK